MKKPPPSSKGKKKVRAFAVVSQSNTFYSAWWMEKQAKNYVNDFPGWRVVPCEITYQLKDDK